MTESSNDDARDAELPPPPSSLGPDFPLPPGSMLGGKYLVEKVIAKGGIGVVLAASHVQLDLKVAIKYLQPRYAEDKSFVDRFTREARLTAKIRSQHVVRVHDVAEDPRIGPYMVMEFLEGEDLDKVLERGPLSPETAVDCVVQACDALAEAHALGVIHRDLKPGNLFLARLAANSSVLKIIDFGISKEMPKGTGESATRITGAFSTVGSPVYMSPEQLHSDPAVDARADIWAMGVVLFELLTGTSPFDGPDLPQLVTSILTQEPLSLAILRPDAPPEIEHVVRKCLEKDPEKRYRNVAELVQDLEPFVPASSAERIRHIKRVVREVSSIRPPTPMPGSIRIENIQRALLRAAQPSSPAFDTGRSSFHKHIETLAEPIPITELAPPSGEPAVAPNRRARIAWIVAALVLLAAVITVAAVPPSGPGQSQPVSVPVPSQPSAIAVPAPSGTTFAETSPAPPAPPATGSAAPVASVPPRVPTPVQSASLRGARSADGNLPPPPSASVAPVARPPTEPATSKPADDYSQFGERR